jgi:hypothetical protein
MKRFFQHVFASCLDHFPPRLVNYIPPPLLLSACARTDLCATEYGQWNVKPAENEIPSLGRREHVLPTLSLSFVCLRSFCPATISIMFLLLTMLTPKASAEMPVTPCHGDHPWPIYPRRLMTHVLRMSAGQVSHPVTDVVLMKSDNRLLHHVFLSP